MVSCLYCVHPEKWFFTTLLEYRRSNLCRIFLSLAFLFSAFMLALPPASAQVTSAEPEEEMLQTEQVQEEGEQDEMTPDMDLLLREVIFKHPQIAAASARSCRANYSLNIAKARNRPQITGSLEGNSALLSSVDYNDDTEKGRQLRGRAFNKPAYDVSRYGSLEGIVTNIATNTTEEANLPPYYETFISIPDPVFSISQARAEAIPGMQVTVDIIGGKRTVLSYLLSPIKRASEVAFREI